MPAASTFDADTLSGATCRRSSLPPAVRFAIFFGVLFALKLGLPHTGLPAAPQVLALAATATLLVWRLWWGCGVSRRGAVAVIATFWLASLAKILIQ